MNRVFITLLCLFPFFLCAQIKPNWQHLDPEFDSVLGVSSYRAYEFLKNKTPKQVIVAIIDNGAELSHEDLQGQFWINPGEIPGNGVDDDKNGYIDDIHGWNFLGNSKGQNIKRETTELTRLYGLMSKKYAGTDSVKYINSKEFKKYLIITQKYYEAVNSKKDEIKLYGLILSNCNEADKILKDYLKKDNYTDADLQSIPDTAKLALAARNYLALLKSDNLNIQKLQGIIDNNKQDLETRLNPGFNIRKEIIGDNVDDLKDDKYGNNQVDAQSPFHGTGVAGIVGAAHNELGINGIAKNVKLMILRILPNGDEQDKDVALAILYAVKNHADIINCSFGKSWSPHPEFVEYAIKKAEKAGVLIVHAAGNDARNNDSIPTFPTGFYSNGKRAANWINVAASQSNDDENLVAYFSSYGKKSVDVFAPGVDLNTCILNSKYELSGGTSIAAPVVSGIAAVIKSYYPELSAAQIKQIIIKSAYMPKTKEVNLPGKSGIKAQFSDLSVSVGIANLYKALLLIEKEIVKKN